MSDEQSPAQAESKTSKSTKARKKAKKSKAAAPAKRQRTMRPYPACAFEEALPLAEAIHQHASGEKVRRLTLLEAMNRSPSSSTTKTLITNSGKYGITLGSYAAEYLSLTDDGKTATDPSTPWADGMQAKFRLAIDGVEPFKHLYEAYKGKRLPSHEVIKDTLREGNFTIADEAECVDIFIVNAKYLGLLRTIAGSETLVSIEQVIEQGGRSGHVGRDAQVDERLGGAPAGGARLADKPAAVASAAGRTPWSKICFYATPIGEEGTEHRKHSDLFLSSIIEPALKDFGMEVIRADQIGEPGMITAQVLEHLLRAQLVIVDLSYHNPDVFYEMAIRHACRLPVVQLTRRADRLPFDVNQVRTVVIDTTDIYTLIPKLETYRSEIATQARMALADANASTNPISVFFPDFTVSLPKEKSGRTEEKQVAR